MGIRMIDALKHEKIRVYFSTAYKQVMVNAYNEYGGVETYQNIGKLLYRAKEPLVYAIKVLNDEKTANVNFDILNSSLKRLKIMSDQDYEEIRRQAAGFVATLNTAYTQGGALKPDLTQGEYDHMVNVILENTDGIPVPSFTYHNGKLVPGFKSKQCR